MEQVLFLSLCVTAIGVMSYGFYFALSILRRVPGGTVKSKWRILVGLVSMFLVAYLASPLLTMLPAEAVNLFMGVVFLAGALFVAGVLKLFSEIISEFGL